jgi:hypothetical protein
MARRVRHVSKRYRTPIRVAMPVMTGNNSDIYSILTAVPHPSRGPDGVVATAKDGKFLGQCA